MLGVAVKNQEETNLVDHAPFFDRAIVLNPGRSYQFQKSHAFEKPGELELFVFALDSNNNPLTFDGAEYPVSLEITSAAQTIFLPIVRGGSSSDVVEESLAAPSAEKGRGAIDQ